MDALSEALNAVRMTSAIFFNMRCTAPWGFAFPPMAGAAAVLAPSTECVVGYHLVTRGRAAIGLEGVDDAVITDDDLVIIPHGESIIRLMARLGGDCQRLRPHTRTRLRREG